MHLSSLSRADWRKAVGRTWDEAWSDNIPLVAAGVSFYGFLALVPLLAAIVLTYGIIADPQTVVKHMRQLTAAMPLDAARFLADQLMFVVTTANGKKGFGLVTAIVISLFSARAAASALIGALNIAYEEDEKRGFFSANLAALTITASAVVFAVLGLLAAASVAYLQELLPASTGSIDTIFKVLGQTVSAVCITGLAAMLYRFGPCRPTVPWRFVLPGAVLFAAVWIGLTLGFGFYVANFGSFGATYGALATIAIFLTWMYVASMAFLIGAELNSELEHQLSLSTA